MDNWINNIVECMFRYVGQTVTIFTTSGGLSGSGFTGVLLSVDCNVVRLLCDVGAPPACSVGSCCTSQFGPTGALSNDCSFIGNPLGAIAVIPTWCYICPLFLNTLKRLVKTMISKRKFFKKSDIILITALLILSPALYFLHGFVNRNQNTTAAEILVDGKVERQVSLEQDSVFSLEGRPNVVFEIRGNSICFQASDCPDQVCVRSGFMNQTGQMAACLPNNMAVRIVGLGDAPPDAPDLVA